MKATIIAAVFVADVFMGSVMTKGQSPVPPNLPVQRVTGIGGVFFTARDAKALGAWYRDTLGITLQGSETFSLFEWRERGDLAIGCSRSCGRSARESIRSWPTSSTEGSRGS